MCGIIQHAAFSKHAAVRNDSAILALLSKVVLGGGEGGKTHVPRLNIIYLLYIMYYIFYIMYYASLRFHRKWQSRLETFNASFRADCRP